MLGIRVACIVLILDLVLDYQNLDGAEVPPVQDTLQRFLRHIALVHGCEYGLQAEKGSDKGLPVKKMWRIDSHICRLSDAPHVQDGTKVAERQTQWTCFRCHRDRGARHAKCAGRVTHASQRFPESLARVIHIGWQLQVDGISDPQSDSPIHVCASVVSAGRFRKSGSKRVSVATCVNQGVLQHSDGCSGLESYCYMSELLAIFEGLPVQSKYTMPPKVLPDAQVRAGLVACLNVTYQYAARQATVRESTLWRMSQDPENSQAMLET